MGEDKALLSFGNFKTLTEFQLSRLSKIFSNVYISCKDQNKFDFQANFLEDDKNISTFAQVAAIAALEDIEYTNAYVREVNKAKEWFVRSFKECNNTHKQVFCGYGNFVLIEFNNESYKDNFIGVLSQNEIFVRDLSHIEGMKSFVRITIGVLDQMKYFMKVLNLNRE